MSIKYKHLWAWDTMMNARGYYKDQQQKYAAATKAPINAIYRNGVDTWATADEIKNDELRNMINTNAESIS